MEDKKTNVVNEEEVKQQGNIEDNKEKDNKKDTKKKKTTKKKTSTLASKLEKKEKEIEELGYKLSDVNDKYIRLSAEFDNYRKRTLKEKMEMMKTAGADALSDILPVIDDFERAMESMNNTDDIVAVKEGIDLIYNKFKDFIKTKGIQEIEAANKDFDTDFHEALTKIPAPEENLKGKVIDVIQKGYKIDEKVIRYAKVVVGE
jgi:molecular chaperone GrpE